MALAHADRADRSGFYSYTPLENLFGCEMPKVEALKPERKPRPEGETVWFCAPEHFKGQGYMVAAVVEPQKTIVMVSGPDWASLKSRGRGAGGSWGFVWNQPTPITPDFLRVSVEALL